MKPCGTIIWTNRMNRWVERKRRSPKAVGAGPTLTINPCGMVYHYRNRPEGSNSATKRRTL